MMPKFRAWDKVDKKLRPVYSMDFNKNREVESIKIKYTKPNEMYGMFDAKEFEFMQSTGLKDKNGVEIYEGDIIEFEDETYQNEAMVGIINRAQVIIDNIQGVFLKNFMVRDSVTYGDYTNYYDFPTHEKSLFFKQCRVVGNVFEDESLLEDE